MVANNAISANTHRILRTHMQIEMSNWWHHFTCSGDYAITKINYISNKCQCAEWSGFIIDAYTSCNADCSVKAIKPRLMVVLSECVVLSNIFKTLFCVQNFQSVMS